MFRSISAGALALALMAPSAHAEMCDYASTKIAGAAGKALPGAGATAGTIAAAGAGMKAAGSIRWCTRAQA